MAKPKYAKKKKHIFLKILLALLILILLVVGVSAVLNTITNTKLMTYANSFSPIAYDNQLKPERDKSTDCITFTTDEDFRVMQLSDLHLGGGFLSYDEDIKALTAAASMIAAEKPDLVIFTGDQVFPVYPISGTINNIRPVRALGAMMERLGVYWCVCLGNHDTELYSVANRAKVSKIYADRSAYPHSLFEIGPDEVDGCGNYAVNVKNSKGLITRTFYLLDSHAYTNDDVFGIFWHYDNLHQNQIAWYNSQVKKMNDCNRQTIASMKLGDEETKALTEQYGNVKSLLFLHIPLHEYRDAFDEYAKNGYKDTENVKRIYGAIGEKDETIYCSDVEDEMFEAILEAKSTQGVFCGHDHYNTSSMDYKGIRLTYGSSIDYLAFVGIDTIGSQRGCTTITAHADTTWDYGKENYYQAKYESSVSEQVTMQTLNPNMTDE
ncbi:MAG TPA: hypothetical protein DDY98_05890 [Ruminococcaceae bacterium]|nr:hypothetical protein [Oscillospiraceae bacterium]